MQERLSKKHPHMLGAFSGGFDEYADLSTGMGLVTLLNIGEEKARSLGILERYRTAVETAVDYLLKSRISQRPYAQAALLAARNPIQENFKWKAGTFFSASDWNLAHWRSEPYTVAIILEGFAKYQLGWQKNDKSLSEMIEKITVDL